VVKNQLCTRGLFHIGKVWEEVGDSEKSLEQYGKAREAWAALEAESGGEFGASRSYLADCDNKRGDLLIQRHRLDEAEEALVRDYGDRDDARAEHFDIGDVDVADEGGVVLGEEGEDALEATPRGPADVTELDGDGVLGEAGYHRLELPGPVRIWAEPGG